MIEKFLNKLAHLISFITIPPIFSLILFIILGLNFNINSIFYYLIVILFGFLFHIIWVIVLLRFNLIDDWQIEKKEQRKYLFVGSITIYIIGLISMVIYKIPNPILVSWFIYIISTTLIYFINLYWKISIHLVGSSGAIFIIYYLLNINIFLLSIPFVVGWARVYLKKHTIWQVVGGYIIGIVIPFTVFRLFNI